VNYILDIIFEVSTQVLVFIITGIANIPITLWLELALKPLGLIDLAIPTQ